MQATNLLYGPLDPTRHEIRLLESVCPDLHQPDDHLCFRLTHHSLDSKPVFKALSYTWGKPFYPEGSRHLKDYLIHAFKPETLLGIDARRSIFVNGDEVSVTKNLWDALVVFPTWKSIPPMPFWVDALCINQANLEEKCAQVQQMHNIYRQAAYVISWLGPEANDSASAIYYLDSLGTVGIKNIERGVDVEGNFQQLVKAVAGFIAVGKFPLQQIQDLARRTYWRRIWVLQEMFFADRVLFICGGSEIRHLYFDEGLRIISAAINEAFPLATSGDRVRLADHACHYSRVVLLLRLACLKPADSQKAPLFHSLATFSPISYMAFGYESSNPWDNIFALLNMTSDNEELAIQPDYAVPVKLVYIKTAVAILRQGNISLLSICQPRKPNDDFFPSWVPNFYEGHGRVIEGHIGGGQFKAAKNSRPRLEFQDPDSDRCLLKVSGFRVDVVKETGTFFKEDWVETEEATNVWLEHIEAFWREMSPNAYSHEEHDILWRIPTMDMEISPEASGDPASSEAGLTPPYSRRATERTRKGYQALREQGHESVEQGHESVEQGHESVEEGHESVEPVQSRNSHKEAYKHALVEIVRNRQQGKPFSTKKHGYIGIGGEYVQAGDLVVIFLGAAAPFVLSEIKPGLFRSSRECYVHGIMDGELMDRSPSIEQFVLK